MNVYKPSKAPTKKQNMTKKDQGYMDKLTLKIIDNL